MWTITIITIILSIALAYLSLRLYELEKAKKLVNLYVLLILRFELRRMELMLNNPFICTNIDRLNVSDSDKKLLTKHFKSQRPTPKLHSDFYHHELSDLQMPMDDILFEGAPWWKTKGMSGIDVRVNFLRELLEIAKNDLHIKKQIRIFA